MLNATHTTKGETMKISTAISKAIESKDQKKQERESKANRFAKAVEAARTRWEENCPQQSSHDLATMIRVELEMQGLKLINMSSTATPSR